MQLGSSCSPPIPKLLLEHESAVQLQLTAVLGEVGSRNEAVAQALRSCQALLQQYVKLCCGSVPVCVPLCALVAA